MLKKLNQIKDITKDMNILYVEDDDSLRSLTVTIFDQIFKNVIVATNGNEGFETYKEHIKKCDIELIISDIEMPKMNGIEMVKKIKLLNASIPVVFLTGCNENEYFLSSIDLSIDGFMIKPLNIEEFIDLIIRISEKYFSINYIQLEHGFIWTNKLKELKKDEKIIKLTKNEKQLLNILVSKKRVVSQDTLEYLIFPDLEYNNKRIRNMISRLNIKLGEPIIESVYSLGYKIKLQNKV